ncbi:MAG: APC family permease, partial [Sinobacteraceae bacterium]|nr:APC family permease [Nevskiaceae bacterium]
GTYTLELLAPSYLDSHWAVGLAGGAWNVIVTLLAIKGLKMATRFEWAIVVFQYAALLLVACLGIAALSRADNPLAFSWHWLTLEGMGGMRGLTSGILVACFMYSGWDAAVYVNEESADPARNPGRAAVASVVLLAIVYAVCLLGLQAVLPEKELQQHAGDALAIIAARLLPGPGGVIMSLVVLTGTLATLQAAVISAARMGLAMSRDGVMPKALRYVDSRTGNPWVGTLILSAFNLALLAVLLSTNDVSRALGNVVSSLGLLAILFYALTAAAAVWQSRRSWLRSPTDLLMSGLLPGVGMLFMVWVAVESILSGATPPQVLIYGLGSIGLGGLMALLIRCFGRTRFFQTGCEDRSIEKEHVL